MTKIKAGKSTVEKDSISILLILGCVSLLSACSSSSRDATTASATTASQASTSATFTFTQTSYSTQPGSNVQLTVTGGTSPYTYSIVSGSGFVDSSAGLFTAPSSSGTTIIQAKDATGLIADTDVVYSSSTTTGSLLISIDTNPIYVNGHGNLSASGGTPPYVFTKIAGEGTISGSAFTAGPDAGTVQIQVTDSAFASGSASLSVSAVSQLMLTPASATVAVNNSIDFSAGGGIPPYTFTVLSGPGSFNGAIYLSATAGTATVAVRDNVGHQATGTVTVGSGTTASSTISSNFSVLTDDQLGITLDNALSGQSSPVLVFFGTGSQFTDPTYLDHTTESQCQNGWGDVLSPCAVKIPLTNFVNSAPGSTTYEGTITYNGRSASGTIGFCIDPSNRFQVLMNNTRAMSFAQTRYGNYNRILLGGRLMQSGYTQVDSNGGAGTVTISISGAGYTSNSSCGGNFSGAAAFANGT